MERCHQCHWHGCTKIFQTTSCYSRRHHIKTCHLHMKVINEVGEDASEADEVLSNSVDLVSLSISPSITSLSSNERLMSTSSILPSPISSIEKETQTCFPIPTNTTTLSNTIPLDSWLLKEEEVTSLPQLIRTLQSSLSQLSTTLSSIPTTAPLSSTTTTTSSSSSSTQVYRAIANRLDQLQATLHRYHLQWTAHSMSVQKTLSELK
ncbi:hypothetical protein HMI54_008315 [Coelomomyces lativittatus]|nr:hypothetical protein HMI54_008315 [Coelomomyces lativittatus]